MLLDLGFRGSDLDQLACTDMPRLHRVELLESSLKQFVAHGEPDPPTDTAFDTHSNNHPYVAIKDAWHNVLVQTLPAPCPAHLIPDATGTEAFHDAYRRAMAQHAVFVAIEFENRQRWTVKADTLTAGPGHAVTEAVNDAVRAAITRLVQSHEADLDAYKGPIYFMMHGLRSEERARELAAALHAALYGNLTPLTRAVPSTT
ncbi:hypothetical protein [Streptomyces sp. RP5T]|uniref:hypothetical protein n=1 Tax=Streptomyces sp. RP5T TaxID=2490848 RepID=UPI0021AE2F30|nr:hypothetical protein [Streptomyces sp. RP5T]